MLLKYESFVGIVCVSGRRQGEISSFVSCFRDRKE